MICPKCKCQAYQRRGAGRYTCKSCGKWYNDKTVKKEPTPKCIYCEGESRKSTIQSGKINYYCKVCKRYFVLDSKVLKMTKGLELKIMMYLRVGVKQKDVARMLNISRSTVTRTKKRVL